jgi:SAM-dependent methyltransferase/uncharacterized protein YbaR (Trm112 family)
MRYSLLDLIVCPACRQGLTVAFPSERPSKTAMRDRPARRMGRDGAAVGPPPEGAGKTGLVKLVERLASEPSSDGRDSTAEIAQGLLLCLECESWYPIRDGLPELLPLHLRFWDEDRAWLEKLAPRVRAAGPHAGAVVDCLLAGIPDEKSIAAAAAGDAGGAYKKAEMSVTRRPLPEGFFGPAALAPFNPCRPQFSVDLIARFASAVPLLRAATNGLVLDLGCGYAWTTEWLVRLGFRAVGLDLSRDYILAGRPRMGENAPHLVVGDAENIPLRPGCADAVLAFDAFHHLPGRRRALSELGRVLKPGGRVAMVEPGPGHEDHPGSVSAMKRHGILERGVDPAALAEDVRGTGLGRVEAHPSPEPTLVVLTVEKEGPYLTDSLAPHDLVAGVEVFPAEGRATAGRPVEVEIALANLGDTTWLARTPGGVGEVRLGAKLLDADREVVREDLARVILPRDLGPGQGVRMRFALPAVSRPGSYLVEFDPVDQWFLWFKDYRYQPVFWPLLVEEEEGKPRGEAAGAGPPSGLVSARWADVEAVELAFFATQLEMHPPPPNPDDALPRYQARWRAFKREGPVRFVLNRLPGRRK